MIPFVESVLDAIQDAHGDDYIREPRLDQDPRDIYTETHFALANLLRFIVAGNDPRRLEIATHRFGLFETLETETPFNNFAVSLDLLLLKKHEVEHEILEEQLTRLCSSQKLTHQTVWEKSCGNNMYIMQVAVDQVLRPLALGRAVEAERVDRLLAELEKFRDSDGFFFDAPRCGSGPRYYPLAYCMKFLFLIAVCNQHHRDPRLEELFVRGMAAALPLMTAAGDFSYFGRSAHTTFAAGLTIFNLRMAAAWDPDHAGVYHRLHAQQKASFKDHPRTRGGWLDVNRFGAPDDPLHPRDSYAYPTEYSAAAACYVLMSRLSVQEKKGTSGDEASARLPLGVHRADGPGIAVLRNHEWEAAFRIGSTPELFDHRLFGPTLLHLTQGEQTLVGAVPANCSADFECRPHQGGKVTHHLNRFIHDWLRGADGVNALYTGYVPVIVRGGSLLFPGAPWEVEMETAEQGGWLRSRHPLVACSWRGPGIALKNLFALVLKNLMTRYPGGGKPRLTKSAVVLERTVRLDGRGLMLSDRLDGTTANDTVRIGLRVVDEQKPSVKGLSLDETLTCRSSNGRSRLLIYRSTSGNKGIQYEVDLKR